MSSELALYAAINLCIQEHGIIPTLKMIGEYLKPRFLKQNKILQIYLGEIEGISKE